VIPSFSSTRTAASIAFMRAKGASRTVTARVGAQISWLYLPASRGAPQRPIADFSSGEIARHYLFLS